MKAIVCHVYGSPDFLKCEEVQKPIAGDNEVLIRVCAASVNPLDWHLKKGSYLLRPMTGLRKPKDPRVGVDVAGQVETIGKNVIQFKPGDVVFGSCHGAFAEYACASESDLVMKPENVTFEQAAAVPVAAYTALQGLRDTGKIKPGQKVLINGAAGGVGTLTVQIARWFGADVTGVCSTRNVDLVRSLGADRVIDYTLEDFTKSLQRYDLIFDLVANQSLSAYRRVLNPTGIYIGAGVLGQQLGIGIVTGLIKTIVLSRFVSQGLVSLMARRSKEDLTIMHELMKTGKVTPVIDRQYSLSEVPEAIRYMAKGHARGKVIITMEHNNKP
jgi:NADPH:quinone reductase-like Zn-dependent oxidoreductase